MAPSGWRADSCVMRALFQRPYEFDFFQAVRLLTLMRPERKPVGTLAKPGEEAVRFHSSTTLAFPASTVTGITRDRATRSQIDMSVAFFGLTGVGGALPLAYTERLLALKSKPAEVLSGFFDLFNHRLISLFYRAWQKHRFVAVYEDAARRDTGLDLFTRSLFNLIGLGVDGLGGRMSFPDEALLPYAGLVAQRPCSASALRGILRDFFRLPVQIEQCLGSWYSIEDADRCYLSEPLERSQVGVGSFLGDRVWDPQARFRLALGPLPHSRFQTFLPGGEEIEKLRDLVRLLVGQALVVDVQLILQAEEVPDPQLRTRGMRLGYDSWLKTEPFTHDPGDAVFSYVN